MGKGRGKLPKRFASDYINTSKGIDQVKTQAHEIYQNRNRVRTTAGRRDQMEPVMNNTFMQPIPDVKQIAVFNEEAQEFIPTPKMPLPRRAALEAKMNAKVEDHVEQTFEQNLEYWVSHRLSGFTSWNYFVVDKKGVEGELRLYFNRERWVFVQLYHSRIVYSRTYASKSDALSTQRRGRIYWAGEKTVNTEV